MKYNAIIIDGGIARKSWKVDGNIWGCLSTLLDLRLEFPGVPQIFAWDAPDSHVLRRKILPGYKSNRQPSSPEYAAACLELAEWLPLAGIQQCQVAGYEADDICNSLALQNAPCLIVTGDSDLFQCVDYLDTDRARAIHVYYLPRRRSGTATLLTPDTLANVTGRSAGQWFCYKCTAGDPGDKIPGIPRCGPDSAKQILKACPNFVSLAQNPTMESVDRASAMIGAVNPNLLIHLNRATQPGKARDTFLASVECVRLKLPDTRGKIRPAKESKKNAIKVLTSVSRSITTLNISGWEQSLTETEF